jgi:hypothetical protein
MFIDIPTKTKNIVTRKSFLNSTWTGLNWIKLGSSDRLLFNEPFGSLKCTNQFSDCQLLRGDFSTEVVFQLASCNDNYFTAHVTLCYVYVLIS